jgi:short-subunit dehydrogenase
MSALIESANVGLGSDRELAYEGGMGQRRGLALVTGASSGIGRSMAVMLAREGFDLALVARRRELLDELAKELPSGTEVRVITADLTEPSAPERVISALEGRPVEVLVNNAGGGWVGAFDEAPLPRQLEIIDLNVRALVELTHRVLGPMKAAGRGHVVQIASVAGFLPGPLASVYYASKAFVVSHAEALRAELAGSGVSVTLVCPGPVATEFQRSSGVRGSFGATVGMTADEVARAAVDGLLRGTFLVVPGASNAALVALSRVVPNRLLAAMVQRLQKKRLDAQS